MGRIHLTLPGNATHSNVSPKKWEEIDRNHAGLDAIGRSGVPVSVSYQGIDYELWPWLTDTLTRYPSLEVIDAPYSHAFLPLMHPKQQRWEISQNVVQHPVSFFAEFYSPSAEFIKNAFFVLATQTVAYSVGFEEDTRERAMLPAPLYVGENIEKLDVIQYGGKIGLVMRGFEPILQAFFAFQRDPVTPREGALPLDILLNTIEDTVTSNDGVIIMPLDIEAPFVGSLGGAEVWGVLFNGIQERNLTRHFISLSGVLEELRPKAELTRRPHRILGTKWSKYEIQMRYLARVGSFVPHNEREHRMLALAATSDVLSGLCTKIDRQKKKTVLSARDFDGREGSVEIGYNQEVVDVGFAALHALQDKQSLVQKIQEQCDLSSLFIQRVLAWAEKYDL